MAINMALMMTVRSWAFLFLLFCFGCALPPELQEAGDRFVYVFEGEPAASREDISPSSLPVEDEAPEDVVTMEMTPVVMGEVTPAVPLGDFDRSLDIGPLPSIYEQKPEVVQENVSQAVPVYKVIKVGEEEIRVIDKGMGSVDKSDLEILRTQVEK